MDVNLLKSWLAFPGIITMVTMEFQSWMMLDCDTLGSQCVGLPGLCLFDQDILCRIVVSWSTLLLLMLMMLKKFMLQQAKSNDIQLHSAKSCSK